MEVIILGPAWPYRGGIAAFSERLAREYQSQGHEVELVTFTLQYPGFLFPGKTQYSTEPAPEGLGIRRMMSSVNPFSWLRTGRYIRRQRPDLVVSPFWLPFMAPCLGTILRVAKRKGMRRVAILHNLIPHEHRPGDKLFARYFVRSNDAFVTLSRSVLEDIDRFDPERKRPRCYSPHPLYDHYGAALGREEALQLLNLPADRRYVLFFGFIRDYKGLDLLIDAMPLLPEDCQLVIAGESYGSFEKYEAQIAASPARERIKVFNRYIGDEEVPAFFSAPDLCVLPYKSATQSGITAISTHFGVPVVATPVGGLPQSVGGTGIGVMTESVSAEAIAKAVSDFDTAQEASCKAAIAAFKAENTWEKFAGKLLSFAGTL